MGGEEEDEKTRERVEKGWGIFWLSKTHRHTHTQMGEGGFGF